VSRAVRPRALGIAVVLLALALAASAWAQAVVEGEAGSRVLPGLRVAPEDAGETSVRVPVDRDRALQRWLSPYVSLDSRAVAPGSALRADSDFARELSLGAGVSLPVSERVEFFSEYHFLRLRPEAAGARRLLDSQSDASGLKAGFTIRLD
jgi:hypothetical protein